MKNKQPHISFFLAKLPLLLLYVSFFIVQLFYNFDITGHTVNIGNASICKADKKANSIIVKKASHTSDNKTSFRLNKRYHPQPAITCNPVIIKQVVCYVSSRLHVHYSNGFTPSSFPPAHSLRGPPSVV